MKTTLELCGAQTGNCIRAAIALEEAGLSYTPKLVDLSSGAQRGVDHLALNPAGKVPVLVENEEDREPFILTQSNAIFMVRDQVVRYLAELPTGSDDLSAL